MIKLIKLPDKHIIMQSFYKGKLWNTLEFLNYKDFTIANNVYNFTKNNLVIQNFYKIWRVNYDGNDN